MPLAVSGKAGANILHMIDTVGQMEIQESIICDAFAEEFHDMAWTASARE